MSKHTEGPWVAKCYENGHECWVVPSQMIRYDELMLYDGNMAGNGSCCKMTQANARLIAAAPEMLDMLQRIRNNNGAMLRHQRCQDELNALIKKAKGEG